MQFTTSILALAALSTSVLAGPHHRHFHQKKSPLAQVNEALSGAPVQSSSATPTTTTAAASSPASTSSSSSGTGNDGSTSTASSVLSGLGIKAAQNSNSANGGAWLGSGGAYTNTFINSASQAITVVVWGPDASWVNANAPYIGVTIPAGGSQVISIASGVSGGWSAIYSDTTLVNGQISNSWGEFTTGQYGTFDVSREPNMSGHTMSISVPGCTSNMSTCVFTCNSGNICGTAGSYSLTNCATGSQENAQYGTYDGQPSGGCGFGTSTSLTTTFS